MKKNLPFLSKKWKYSFRFIIVFIAFFGNLKITNAQNQFVLKFFIQGYYIGGNMMRPVLYNQCISGGGSPASCSPTYPTTDVDDVIIELHETSSPYNMVPGLSYTSRLKTSGLAEFNAPTGLYYIVIIYPNAIQTWSHDPVQIDGSHLFYDFSLSANKAYGDNQSQEYFHPITGNPINDAVYKIYSGDVTDPGLGYGYQDGIVESADYSDMENEIYYRNCCFDISDLNGEGGADLLDFIIIDRNVYFTIIINRPY